MSDVIVARSVTKTYRTGVGRARVREMLPSPFDRAVRAAFPSWWSKDSFNALDDVSLSVPAGASLGIVGHNGAGKTTLLKVISGVTAPASGRVDVHGRVGALIDVVIGFHPDLTGRENVYLLAAMNGRTSSWVDRRIDEVLAFAELHDAADTPIKRYSAGMTSRLGFATMTALDSEALLIDEILSVGDASFQRKCMTWLAEYRARGGTLLFVSHNLGLLRSMTERAVRLDHGRIVDEGPTSDVLARYARARERRATDEAPAAYRPGLAWRQVSRDGMNRWGAGGARVEEVDIQEPAAGASEIEVVITYAADEDGEALFCLGFADEQGREIGASVSSRLKVHAGNGVVRCAMRPLALRTGIYFPVVAILSPDGRVRDRWKLERAVVVDRAGEIALAESFGPVEIPAAWSNGNVRGRRR